MVPPAAGGVQGQWWDGVGNRVTRRSGAKDGAAIDAGRAGAYDLPQANPGDGSWM